jgi:hypothetical protein
MFLRDVRTGDLIIDPVETLFVVWSDGDGMVSGLRHSGEYVHDVFFRRFSAWRSRMFMDEHYFTVIRW